MNTSVSFAHDPHSCARPEEAVIKHLELDLQADFDKKILKGSATLHITRSPDADTLWLDTKSLQIEKIFLDREKEATWELKGNDPILGSSLAIAIDKQTTQVKVFYSTSPEAEALQWLDPEQTYDKKNPFLFTQSQAILARTWIPLQDAAGIRFTYEAKITCPKHLLPLMSAENPQSKNDSGVYRFKMPQPISSYLMALCIGNLEFRSLSSNSGVYAEPGQIEKAAWEFADMPGMIKTAESLYGPYRWGRYDVVVLPPSFPFGGMENPRLTFATPTIIAGDRSLVSLIAHELAHSWSGNLVTNATWNDFWLNEGFTVYFEQRIMEQLYGKEYAEMLAALSLEDLKATIAEMGATNPDTHLQLQLEGRNPDDGVSDIAYEKGRFFIRVIEAVVGRPQWDKFLNTYFNEHAFQSMTTEKFLGYLDTQLLKGNKDAYDKIRLKEWIYGPGLPDNCPKVLSAEFDRVDNTIKQFDEGAPCNKLDTSGFTTHHWLYFLRNIKQKVSNERLTELDKTFGFNQTGNSEIAFQWFILCIRNHYAPADPYLEKFLTHVGRRKFVKPLFAELIKTPEGKQQARAIYKKARNGYHAVTRNTVDELLAKGE